MRSSRLPPALHASTICAVLLFATSSCVSAQSPSTTTSHSTTPTPSPSDPIDPNAISTGNSSLSNGAIAGLSACGGIIFVFCIAITLFVWNRRATRDMPDVQDLVLSDGGDEERRQGGGINAMAQLQLQLQQQRRRRQQPGMMMMAGPLSSRGSDHGPYEKPPLTPPEAAYRKKKGSDASDYDLEMGLDGVRGLRSGGRDWVDALDGDEEAVLQAAVARVVSGKS